MEAAAQYRSRSIKPSGWEVEKERLCECYKQDNRREGRKGGLCESHNRDNQS
jgi:hypothetical protein